ncbi:MAG: site-specific DNA-methyltransferase, partial [Chloroflexota bacterium]|nr:site-specific DNA-methyltransferase [Chloroflexota bacterium]
RLDQNPQLRDYLIKYCRLSRGEIWTDPQGKHKIGCLDATDQSSIKFLMGESKATLAIQDPPYNLIAFEQRQLDEYIHWCKQWIATTRFALSRDASLYVWLGADQNSDFQPLPDFMIAMRRTGFKSRSYITMRNQRGYGTQKNWMAVRQELLYYTKGNPVFDVSAEYTDIPKILRGYYKEVTGTVTENLERGKSDNIRAGNVWVDIQQVFYRMEENVNGCYAQKPLKSCERIIKASSSRGDLVIDFFCHSGSTMISSEMLGRNCYTVDIDPVYCEVAIRRLERFRRTGKTGWQNSNPFEQEIATDQRLAELLGAQQEESENVQYALSLE